MLSTSVASLANDHGPDLAKLRGGLLPNDHTIPLKIKRLTPSRSPIKAGRNFRGSILLEQSADAKHAFEFSNFLRTALGNSNELRASLHEAGASHYNVAAARWAFLPTVNLRGTWERQRTSGVLSDTSQLSIGARWTIFSSGKNWSELRAAQHSALGADFRYLAAERQLMIEYATTYLRLVAARSVAQEIRNTYSRVQSIYSNTKRLVHAGFASKLDLAQAKAELAQIKSELASAQSNVKQVELEYERVSGGIAPSKLHSPKLAHLMPHSLEDALARTKAGNYQVLATQADSKAAWASSRSRRADFLPRLELFANGSQNLEQGLSHSDRDWNMGLQVTVPLGDMRNFARYREAKQRAIAASYRATDASLAAQQNVKSLWHSQEMLARQTSSLTARAKAIQNASYIARRQMKAGLIAIDDVLRQEINLADARITKIQTQLQYKIAIVQLLAQYQDLNLSDLGS